jgi:DNA helicase HerA-like ATPase
MKRGGSKAASERVVRPSELSPTIVAQCNSFLLHRIVNDRDQELVRKLVPDNAGALLKELPSLPAQQAILLGIATEIPVIVNVNPLALPQQPHSRNPDFWDVWTGERVVTVDFGAIVEDWRG